MGAMISMTQESVIKYLILTFSAVVFMAIWLIKKVLMILIQVLNLKKQLKRLKIIDLIGLMKILQNKMKHMSGI